MGSLSPPEVIGLVVRTDVVLFMDVQGRVPIQLFKRWVNSRSAVLSSTPLKPVEDC